MAFNHSQAEVVALGNVLNVDIFMLTYNLQTTQGTPEERTQWNHFQVNAGLANENEFWRNTEEPLKYLHEDEVHFLKLVWMPLCEPFTPPSTNESSSPTIRSNSSMGQSPGSNRNRPCTPTSFSDFETDPSNETIQNTDP